MPEVIEAPPLTDRSSQWRALTVGFMVVGYKVALEDAAR
jgi:hypothetical protein